MNNIRPFEGHWPHIHPSAFIAPTAVLIGQVKIGPRASVWDGCVLRGDVSFIEIGEELPKQSRLFGEVLVAVVVVKLTYFEGLLKFS